MALRTFLRFLILTVLVCVATSAAVSVVVGPLSELLFPGRAEVCAKVMRVTIWSLPLAAVGSIFGSALNALGHDAAQARATLAASICHVVLAGVLIRNYGLAGASWSVVVQEALWLVILTPAIISAFRK